MNKADHLCEAGDGYRRILAASAQDARRYLWSERLAMIAAIGFLVTLGLAVLLPLLELIRGSWRGLGHYLGGIIVLPLPFVVLVFIGMRVHRRVARRHGV